MAESVEETFTFLETQFNHLQTSKGFFAFELLLAVYVLITLALVAERFMLPSLMAISKRYSLSRDMTGIVVALGGLIPELTTTLLSFMRHGVKMTEFGIVTNVGCALFTITVVPAIALGICVSY